MTLVLAAKSSEGLLIASDNRSVDLDRGVIVESNRKLFAWGKHCAYAYLGRARIDEDDGSTRFDLVKWVAQFTAQHAFNEHSALALCRQLHELFMEHGHDYTAMQCPPGEPLFKIDIFQETPTGSAFLGLLSVSSGTRSDVNGRERLDGEAKVCGEQIMHVPFIDGQDIGICRYCTSEHSGSMVGGFRIINNRVVMDTPTENLGILELRQLFAQLFTIEAGQESEPGKASQVGKTFALCLLHHLQGFQWLEMTSNSV